MKTFQFRPTLDRLEDREVPAAMTMAQMGVIAQTQATAALIGHMRDFDWMANPVMRPQVELFVRNIYAQSTSAMKTLTPQAGPVYAAAASNSAFAQQMAGALGFPVVVVPPAAPPKPDAGMTNAMPPANSPSWQVQANGLKTWDVKIGSGTPVTSSSSITVFYTGWLTNGTVFDSKRSPDAPATFALSGLIQGWQQGIPGMRNGGIRRLYVPSALAYGAAGQGKVPPNSDLIFEIKVVSHT